MIPATDADWAEMAADGFNVVRLLVSWSALEPTKGAFDSAYVARIHDAVDAAKAHGIYVVLDMHQDAWGKFVASPAGVTCPASSKPGIGWDGAPDWATITDDADTCAAAGVRELAPAVMHAFDNFYADTDGIQTELTKTWASLAGEFAADPTIAGYDLFNEPNWGTDADSSGAKLGAFTQKTIAAIRAAEKTAGGLSHIAFFEPVVLWPKSGTLPPPATITDDNVVFAPHNYNDSIQGGTIEQGFADAAASAATYGTTFWIGEYGWFGDPATDAAKVAEYAKAEDSYRVGGTWWQWKQACGDPHSVGARDAEPPATLVHLHQHQLPRRCQPGPGHRVRQDPQPGLPPLRPRPARQPGERPGHRRLHHLGDGHQRRRRQRLRRVDPRHRHGHPQGRQLRPGPGHHHRRRGRLPRHGRGPGPELPHELGRLRAPAAALPSAAPRPRPRRADRSRVLAPRHSPSPGGVTGRRRGLKPPGRFGGVRVRSPPRARQDPRPPLPLAFLSLQRPQRGR